MPTVRLGPAWARPGPTRASRCGWPSRFEHELKLGEGESEHESCSAWRSIGVQAGRPVRPGPLRLRRAVRPQPVGLPRRRARPTLRAPRRAAFSSVSHDYVAQRALVDSVPEETSGSARRRPARRGGTAAVRRREPPLPWTTIGAIDRLEIEAGGLHLHRPGLRPARGPAGPAPARLPPDLVGLARPAVGPRAGGLPRRGARPARATAAGPARPRWATTAPSTSSAMSSRWPTPWRWRPSTWSGTTGAACSAWIVGVAPSGAGPLAQRRLDAAPAGAAARAARRRPGAGRPRRGHGVVPRARGARAPAARCRRRRARACATLLAETGLDDEDARMYVAALTEPGALTAALNWYRAMDGARARATSSRWRCPRSTSGRPGTRRSAGRPRRPPPSACRGRTRSRCSRTCRTGSPRWRPSSCPSCCCATSAH